MMFIFNITQMLAVFKPMSINEQLDGFLNIWN